MRGIPLLLSSILFLCLTPPVNSNSAYCEGDFGDVPDYVWQAYADYPDDYPVIPAVDPFKVSAFTGRWYVVATSIGTASVAYQCGCPVIDVGREPPIRYRWQVGQRPDPDINAVVVNPLLAYYEYHEGQPNVFKDPEDTNTEFVANPFFTIYVVKVGPIVNGTYAYYVLAIEHMPWDIAPPPESGFTFPNKGTMTFEVYAQDVEEFYELYADEVEAYVAEQSGDIPDVINTLKLQHFDHTGCIYPYKPSYLRKAVTVSPDLQIHIPEAIFGDTKLWADFKYVPNNEVRLLFEVTDHGAIE